MTLQSKEPLQSLIDRRRSVKTGVWPTCSLQAYVVLLAMVLSMVYGAQRLLDRRLSLNTFLNMGGSPSEMMMMTITMMITKTTMK